MKLLVLVYGLLGIFKNNFTLCMNVLPACICVHHTHTCLIPGFVNWVYRCLSYHMGAGNGTWVLLQEQQMLLSYLQSLIQTITISLLLYDSVVNHELVIQLMRASCEILHGALLYFSVEILLRNIFRFPHFQILYSMLFS